MALETCRGNLFYVIYIKKIVYQVGINKGITEFQEETEE